MSHVPGHVDVPAQSFGVLLPQLEFDEKSKPEIVINNFKQFLKEIGNKEVEVDNNGVVQFPILFVPEKGVRHSKIANPLVGFHPYLIPWEEDDFKHLVIASDVTDWPNHSRAETSFFEKLDSIRHYKKFNPVKTSEEYTNPKENRIEEYYEDFDDLVMEVVIDTDNPISSQDQVTLKKTSRYMKTPSFKTIYLDRDKKEHTTRKTNDVIKWIVKNAIYIRRAGFVWTPGNLTFIPGN